MLRCKLNLMSRFLEKVLQDSDLCITENYQMQVHSKHASKSATKFKPCQLIKCRDIFGGQATEAKVLAELHKYSDYELHSLSLSNGGPFTKFLLEEKHLYSSAKCCFLAKLLPELKVSSDLSEDVDMSHKSFESLQQTHL